MVAASDFGVKPEGFVRPTVQDLIALTEQDLRATIDPDLDLSPDSPEGQIVGIHMNFEALAWEALEDIYDSNDPEKAEDIALTNEASLTGTPRRAADFSRVDLDVTLDSGKTLLSGTHFAAVENNPDSRWTPEQDFTAPADGTYSRTFRAEKTGPISAIANTITVIATPVSGWTFANNPQQPSLGITADDDPTLRTRRQEELTQGGAGTVESIAAEIEAKIPSVLSIQKFNNTTDGFDTNGLPPHSYELVIWDGSPPPAGNADKIAQIIWDLGSAGIQSQGSVPGTATDENGDPQTVYFSRATVREVWLILTGTTRDGFSDDATFKAALAQRCNAFFGTGVNVDPFDVSGEVFELGGFKLTTPLNLGFAPSPVGTTELVTGARAIPRFDSSRITLVH